MRCHTLTAAVLTPAVTVTRFLLVVAGSGPGRT
jgi:hypothetical protein